MYHACGIVISQDIVVTLLVKGGRLICHERCRLPQHRGYSTWKKFTMEATSRAYGMKKAEARLSGRVYLRWFSRKRFSFGLVHFPKLRNNF